MSAQPWVDGLTFPQALERTVERFGARECLVFPQLAYRATWRQFNAEVQEVARALLALGVERGEHIGIWATNWPQWVVLQFAAAQVGAVLVTINPAYRPQELEYVLNQADITSLFLTDQFKGSQYFDLVSEVCSELATSPPCALQSARCPKLRRVISIKTKARPGILAWDAFCRASGRTNPADLAARQSQVQPGDVVSIQYTSGTTGFPKGAMLTHRNLLLNAFYVGQRMAFSERDRLCIPVPLYHCFGCVLGTLVCAVYGSAMVFPAEGFDAEATLQALQEERCTALYGVPTMFIAELNHFRFAEFDLRSLRTGIMAGAPCPIEVMRAVTDKMHASEMTIAYGLTEASPIITQTATDDSLEHRVGTVGRAIPGAEVRIVATDSLDPLPSGAAGELIVRSHGVMKGYYNKPAETAAAITSDGWLHTGDVALETADGYYRITGRIKDMIIRGGENIYPREIEEFLYAHPKIADVQVVGLPDEQYGEQVSAWIRLKSGEKLTSAEVQDYCRGHIAHFKIPHYVVFVEEYPSTVTGKIQKYKLRELGIARFGLQKAAGVVTA